jgi:hypothetical protein
MQYAPKIRKHNERIACVLRCGLLRNLCKIHHPRKVDSISGFFQRPQTAKNRPFTTRKKILFKNPLSNKFSK